MCFRDQEVGTVEECRDLVREIFERGEGGAVGGFRRLQSERNLGSSRVKERHERNEVFVQDLERL
jgi:hypothetical protein